MNRTFFALLAASALVAGSATAAEMQTSRSVGSHPIVHDDYPEADLVLDAGNGILLSITGEARTRFEWVENGLDFSSSGTDDGGVDDQDFDDEYYFAPSRYNLGFRVDLPRDVAAVVELQGGYEWGDELGWVTRRALNDFSRPSAFNGTIPVGSNNQKPARAARDAANNDDVYLYQAYIEMANIGDSIFSMRVGRQELAYGTEFILGNRDFYDGISYDAIKGIFEFSDNSRLDLFYAKLNESQTSGSVNGPADDDDANLYGAYYSTQSLGGSQVGMDVYGVALNDNSFLDIEQNTIGVRFFREALHGWHFSAEMAYQFGDVDGTDLEAWAFEGFVGHTWDTPTNPGIHFGMTMATGNDTSSSDYERFFALSGEVHPRLGLGDWIDATNIVAWNLGYTGSKDNHSWGVDVFKFDLEEDNGGEDDLGFEVDLWYNYQYSKNLVAQFAIAWFDEGNLIQDSNDAFGFSSDNAFRLYANLLVRF
jgi:hypothetical protein